MISTYVLIMKSCIMLINPGVKARLFAHTICLLMSSHKLLQVEDLKQVHNSIAAITCTDNIPNIVNLGAMKRKPLSVPWSVNLPVNAAICTEDVAVYPKRLWFR